MEKENLNDSLFFLPPFLSFSLVFSAENSMLKKHGKESDCSCHRKVVNHQVG